MDDCCESKAAELDAIRSRHGRVLVAVLAINASMFVVEFAAGLLSGSTALLADSLDMLGDALVYGFSLFVLHRSARWRARAALSKGLVMAAFGLGESDLKALADHSKTGAKCAKVFGYALGAGYGPLSPEHVVRREQLKRELERAATLRADRAAAASSRTPV